MDNRAKRTGWDHTRIIISSKYMNTEDRYTAIRKGEKIITVVLYARDHSEM